MVMINICAPEYHFPVYFKSSLQLPFHATGTKNHGLAGTSTVLAWEDLAVVKTTGAVGATEALVVPLAAQRADVLADDGLLALAALGRPPLGALGLARHAPGVTVLLDVGHAALKGVAALGAEEVTKVPVGAQSDNVLAHDWRLAMLATGRKELVPIQVTVETKSLVTVLGHRLPGLLGQRLARGAAPDPLEAGFAERVGLRRDFERLERGAAAVAREALRVEPLRAARERHEPTLDGVAALMAASRGTATDSLPGGGRRPVTAGPCCSWLMSTSRGSGLRSRKWTTRVVAGGWRIIVWSDDDWDARSGAGVILWLTGEDDRRDRGAVYLNTGRDGL